MEGGEEQCQFTQPGWPRWGFHDTGTTQLRQRREVHSDLFSNPGTWTFPASPHCVPNYQQKSFLERGKHPGPLPALRCLSHGHGKSSFALDGRGAGERIIQHHTESPSYTGPLTPAKLNDLNGACLLQRVGMTARRGSGVYKAEHKATSISPQRPFFLFWLWISRSPFTTNHVSEVALERKRGRPSQPRVHCGLWLLRACSPSSPGT